MQRIRWFDELSLDQVGEVGGKNASLGEMRRALTRLGIRVPDGFATSAAAYREFMAGAGIDHLVERATGGLEAGDLAGIQRAGRRIRAAIRKAPLPAALEAQVEAAYRTLCESEGGEVPVAVRSSATAEDLPGASFAGQLESFLGVRGMPALLEAVHRCFASLFTDRAISYRTERGFSHSQVALSVGVQRMVEADDGAAGVMFTLDPESGFREVVLISAAYGLGESVVQGTVDADEYLVFKPTLRTGHRPVISRRVGSKRTRRVCAARPGRLRSEPVPLARRRRLALGDDDVLTLARWACAVEHHYSQRYGTPTPMDLEWARDGRTGELFVLQARPETVHARLSPTALRRFHLDGAGEVLARGHAVGSGVGAGPARVIADVEDLRRLKPGEVLVTGMTDPDWEPVLRRAAAIVTDHGGRTCHAAIVSRELGIPAVVGTGDGTARIGTGDEVTVSCAEGEEGRVYAGRLPFHVDTTELSTLQHPRTRILVNVGDPEQAFALAALPVDGVGLARVEFVIASSIGVHPMALLHPERVPAERERRRIRALSAEYPGGADYFVDRLAQGVGRIAAAFWPRDVVVRFSDFKTNEYAHLLGGAAFEAEESNPMLGFRGAARYTDPRYREAFALECEALRRVREEMGLRNVKPMVPFCRTLQEARAVLAEMKEHGLRRGQDGLEVYLMCEIPSNVVLMSEFAPLFDGISIGSNDLTQLTLGVDRDSAALAQLFDERDPAVLRMIAAAVHEARAAGRPIGICGQAVSDYPDFARFVVQQGITSISLNPDSVLGTLQVVLDAEAAAAPAPLEEPLLATLP